MSHDKEAGIVAIITARGGSKGLPGKNIRELAGKPLIAYSIEAAENCSLIADTFVTTDNEEIASISKQYGANIIERPEALATDTASSYDAVKHALNVLAEEGRAYEFFVLLQPTSPLRTAEHVHDCIERFMNTDARSAYSVCEMEHHPYKSFRLANDCLIPLFGEEYLDKARQDLPTIYRQNGAIYMMRIRDFLDRTKTFYLPPAMPYFMSEEDSIDIDMEVDLQMANQIIQKKQV